MVCRMIIAVLWIVFLAWNIIVPKDCKARIGLDDFPGRQENPPSQHSSLYAHKQTPL